MTISVRHEVVGSAAAGDRLRIAQVSDLHLCWSARRLREVDALLAVWRPDLLAPTGDYADTWVGRDLFRQWLVQRARALPVCWIEGNHDRWWGGAFVERLRAVPAARAIDRADAWVTARGGRPVRITSWERRGAGADGGATVVLVHDPAAVQADELRACGAGLVLAGHLHGGQVALWTDRHGRSQPGGLFYRWIAPRTDVGPAAVIVSRGVGDLLPIRVGVPREIVMVDFIPGPQGT